MKKSYICNHHMEMQITEELSKIFHYSKEEAMRTGTYQISPGHMLLGILRHEDNEACAILRSCGADLPECKNFLEARLFNATSIPYCDEDKITLSRSAENAFSMTLFEASMSGEAAVSTKHLLLALSRCSSGECEAYFKAAGIDYGAIKKLAAPAPAPQEDKKETRSAEESINAIKDELISMVELLSKENKIIN